MLFVNVQLVNITDPEVPALMAPPFDDEVLLVNTTVSKLAELLA